MARQERPGRHTILNNLPSTSSDRGTIGGKNFHIKKRYLAEHGAKSYFASGQKLNFALK